MPFQRSPHASPCTEHLCHLVTVANRSDHGLIDEHDWRVVGDNESGYVLPDPTDPDIAYSGSCMDILTRANLHTGQFQERPCSVA